jgi:serine/threonine protein kinase
MDFKERYIYNPANDLLGKGGFARVYKAQDKLLNRTVALKFFVRDTSEKHTLIKEISKAITLDHPNLCRYFDAAIVESNNVHGEKETIEVGVMEYLEAGNIQTYLKLHPQHLEKLLEDVLKGITFLHENNIIHRDLKAQNILVTETARGPVAKITDFGISKTTGSETTSSSALLGTIEYMAPEQFHPEKYGINRKISTNLDFWGFGLLLYEIYTGEKYFGNSREEMTTARVMNSILQEDDFSKLNKLPEPYRSIAKKCLVKNANERVQNAEELIGLLKKGPGNIYEAETRVIVSPGSKPTITEYTHEGNDKTVSINEEKVKGNNSSISAGKKKKWIITSVALLAIVVVLAFVLNSKSSKNQNSGLTGSGNSTDSSASVNISSPATDGNTGTNINTEIDDDVTNIPSTVTEPTRQNQNTQRTNIQKTEKKSESPNQVLCSNCNGGGTVKVGIDCSACKGKMYEQCSSCYSYAGSGKCAFCNGTKNCQFDGYYRYGIDTYEIGLDPGTGKCSTCGGLMYHITRDGKKTNRSCNTCNGSGKCTTCKGTRKCQNCAGEGTCNSCKGSGLSNTPCRKCNATGKGEEKTEPCPVCKGKKYI